MFKQNSKYRGGFLIFAFLAVTTNSVFNFLQFADKNDGMKMIGGIIFGILAIFYIGDIYEFYKIKKASKERHD